MGKGYKTKLSYGRKGSHSLRTTVPEFIVAQFELKAEDYLDWSIEARDGELIIVVRKA